MEEVSHSTAGVLAGHRKNFLTIIIALESKSSNCNLRDSIRSKSLDQSASVVVLTLVFTRNKPNTTGSTRHYVHIKEGHSRLNFVTHLAWYKQQDSIVKALDQF
jgi:hypothetical protein